ncbi:EI24 domain-containing protein [Demequina flava]|uniref:EI24 domain-containing protein n=1 Tax=Demequina flava TaxID=1095025 RepID=UPI0009E1F3F3|nr:EI24 domain-containing protein [Demequina flava]
MPKSPPPARYVGGFFTGVQDVLVATKAWRTHGRTMAWGVLPAVIAGFLLVTAVVSIAIASPKVGEWSADQLSASGWWHTLLQWAVAIGLVVATGLIAIKLFVSIALIIGQPFYERISADVDDLNPADAAAEERWWVTTARGVGDALRLLAISLPTAAVSFGVGFVPVVGAVIGFCLSAAIGGWLVGLELTAYPSARRGAVTLRQRRALLATDRARAWGMGTAAYLLMLIPGAALVVLPVGMVAATKVVSQLHQAALQRPEGH